MPIKDQARHRRVQHTCIEHVQKQSVEGGGSTCVATVSTIVQCSSKDSKLCELFHVRKLSDVRENEMTEEEKETWVKGAN